jgi:hypothetical protein
LYCVVKLDELDFIRTDDLVTGAAAHVSVPVYFRKSFAAGLLWLAAVVIC